MMLESASTGCLRRCAFALALWFLWPGTARADGIAFRGRDRSAMRLVEEREQLAAITHRDGVQRMLISVNFDADDAEQAFWVFPVPGGPQRVSVDVLDSFPRFWGQDPREIASLRIAEAMQTARATQIYPIPGLFMVGLRGAETRISLHASVEKWGIHAEVLTADSVSALQAYLRDRRTGVADTDLEALAPYLSADYSLVVVRIASREELLRQFPEYSQWRIAGGRQPCVFVEFATEKPFYPMRPSSVYDDVEIPVRLYLVGYVKPVAKVPYLSGASIQHYRQRRVWPDKPDRFTGQLPHGGFPYTVVEIRAPAGRYTSDLWFAPSRSLALRYSDWLATHLNVGGTVALGLALLAALSWTAGGLTGLLLLRQWRTGARLGLWNLLTLAGLVVRARHHEAVDREWLFVGLFSILFVSLSVALEVLHRVVLGLPPL